MSNLERSKSRRPSRRSREQRAYTLTLVTGGLAVVAVVGFLLALFGIGSLVVSILAGIIAVVLGFVLRRQLGV